jgi:hypothetical protein
MKNSKLKKSHTSTYQVQADRTIILLGITNVSKEVTSLEQMIKEPGLHKVLDIVNDKMRKLDLNISTSFDSRKEEDEFHIQLQRFFLLKLKFETDYYPARLEETVKRAQQFLKQLSK